MLGDLLQSPYRLDCLTLDHLRGIYDRLGNYISLRQQQEHDAARKAWGGTGECPLGRSGRTVGAAGAMGQVRDAE